MAINNHRHYYFYRFFIATGNGNGVTPRQHGKLSVSNAPCWPLFFESVWRPSYMYVHRISSRSKQFGIILGVLGR